MLQNLMRQLSAKRKAGADTETLKELIVLLNTMYGFKKDIETEQDKADNPKALRELGYRLLDWLPALLQGSRHAVLMNTFMQAGITYQRASQQETEPTVQMADESLAFRLYATAMHLASYTTPDINLHTGIYCLSYIGQFRYQEVTLEHDVPLLKKVDTLADVFPMAIGHQANID